jgi:hypothetical protein
LTLVLVGAVAGTLWQQRAQRAVADEPPAEPVEAPPVVVEQDAQVADVGTDALVAVSENGTETETGKASETDPPLESDEGIDWTVPDFPDEAAPPTGTPDAQPRNPVVIDEPPPPGNSP